MYIKQGEVDFGYYAEIFIFTNFQLNLEQYWFLLIFNYLLNQRDTPDY